MREMLLYVLSAATIASIIWNLWDAGRENNESANEMESEDQ